MSPSKPTPLKTLVYLDTSSIDWTTRPQLQWRYPTLTEDEVYSHALTDFGRVNITEQRLLSETLKACIIDWQARVVANRAATQELNDLDQDIVSVSVAVEANDEEPEVIVRTELLEKIEQATDAFEQALRRAIIRLKAAQTLMIRRAMLGADAEVVFEPPAPYTTSGQKSLSQTDRRNYEVILQLETRTFHSPTQYFREIGRRAVKGRGKPVGHATINGWFKKEGLYSGKEDRDMQMLQARAVARAKRVLVEIQQDSKE